MNKDWTASFPPIPLKRSNSAPVRESEVGVAALPGEKRKRDNEYIDCMSKLRECEEENEYLRAQLDRFPEEYISPSAYSSPSSTPMRKDQEEQEEELTQYSQFPPYTPFTPLHEVYTNPLSKQDTIQSSRSSVFAKGVLPLGIQKLTEQSEFAKEIQDKLSFKKIDQRVISDRKKLYEEQQPNQRPIADPQKCFTSYEINRPSKLFDVLDASKMIYEADVIKDESPTNLTSFGISGQLSIFDLTILALETSKVIADEFVNSIKDEISKIRVNREIKVQINKLIASIETYSNNFERLFRDAFGKNMNRQALETDAALEITSRFITFIQDLTNLASIIYDPNATPTIGQTPEFLFLSDSANLLNRISLTKSSLDVTQACALRYTINSNKFSLFDTYDWSGAVNTGDLPCMSSIKYKGLETEQLSFVLDNIRIMSFLALTAYRDDINFSGELVSFGYTQNIIRQFEDLRREMKDIMRIIVTNEESTDIIVESDLFNQFLLLMDKNLNDGNITLSLYDFLYNFINIIKIPAFTTQKYQYEKISKLFLNYCIVKDFLSNKNLTSVSRDIEAHDYAHSAIRCLGIANFIKRQIYKFMIKFSGLPFDSIPDPSNVMFDKFIKDNFTILDSNIDTFIDNYIRPLECTTRLQRYREYDVSTNNYLRDDQVKVKQFLKSVDYDPMGGYPNKIKNLFTLFAARSATDFEIEQVEQLSRLKTCVMEVEAFQSEGHKARVLLNKGPIFETKSSDVKSQEINKSTVESQKIQGLILITYDVSDAIGSIDLGHRYGLARTKFVTEIKTTVSRVDAAAPTSSAYKQIVEDNSPSQLYYDDYELCTAYSGLISENMKPGDIIGSSFPFLNLLRESSSYNITAQSAYSVFNDLYKFLNYPQINDYYSGCLNLESEIGDNEEAQTALMNLKEEFQKLTSGLNPEPLTRLYSPSELKKNTAGKYFNYFQPIINKFLVNVNTYYETLVKILKYNNPIIVKLTGCLERIFELLYKQLCDRISLSEKAKEIENQSLFGSVHSASASASAREVRSSGKPRGGKKIMTGGGNFVFNSDIGYYITIENGVFTLKQINNVNELNKLLYEYGYEKSINQSDPYGFLARRQQIKPKAATKTVSNQSTNWGRKQMTLADLPKSQPVPGSVMVESSTSTKSLGGNLKSKSNKRNKKYTKKYNKKGFKLVRKTKKRLNKKRKTKRRKN